MSCNWCNKDYYIVNKHFGLCNDCNYKRLHKGLTRFEVAKSKKKVIKKKVATGEGEMFLEIWNERPHYCEEEDCGVFLGHEPKTWFFSHDKPKSVYPELRLVKTNVKLRCYDCHDKKDKR